MRKLTSTNFENQQRLAANCEAAYTMSLISGRWKLSLLNRISEGVTRFSALKIAIPAITERVLALQLRQLEDSGLIERSLLPESNRFYSYSLSDSGKKLIPVIQAMATWAKNESGIMF